MDEPWEDNYMVIFYSDGELQYKNFPNNPEAAQYIEELAELDMDFDPHIHAMVIKTEAGKFAILDVRTERKLKVTVGGY